MPAKSGISFRVPPQSSNVAVAGFSMIRSSRQDGHGQVAGAGRRRQHLFDIVDVEFATVSIRAAQHRSR